MWDLVPWLGIEPRPPALGVHWLSHSEKAMAPHSSTLAWKIPWTQEPGRLQSMGSLRVGHDWATSLSLFTFMHWRIPISCLENPRDGGAWWAAVCGVSQSWTWLKQLSSSSRLSHWATKEVPTWGTLKTMMFLLIPNQLKSSLYKQDRKKGYSRFFTSVF